MQIVIEVSGGCVTRVLATEPVDVIVRDFDNIDGTAPWGPGDPDPCEGMDLSAFTGVW